MLTNKNLTGYLGSDLDSYFLDRRKIQCTGIQPIPHIRSA